MKPVRQSVVSLAVALLMASVGAHDAAAQSGSGTTDPVAAAGCARSVAYGPSAFGGSSASIRNRYLPLAPGTQLTFEGRSSSSGAVLPHRVVFTVTALTKTVDGVRSAVVWDVDVTNGQVVEAELALFAQDRAGNVWNLGEYPELYPAGVFAGAPDAWFAGVADAEPGIHMLQSPAVGAPEYLQGSVPHIGFLDCAKIVESGASVCVPSGCYNNVLVVHERSPLEPLGGTQVKYHAPGVGIVQIGAINDPEGETLVLNERRTLTAAELHQANRDARKLDQRGLQCSDVYQQTAPLEGPDAGDLGPFTCPPPRVSQPPVVVPAMTTSAGFSTDPEPAAPPAPVPVHTTATTPPNPLHGRYLIWVDHPLFPLLKVATSIYEGQDHGVAVRVERRVRPVHERVAGILATVVDSRRFVNGTLVQRSNEFFAQDRKGNVLLLGRRIKTIKNGRTTGQVRRWIAGRNGAKPVLFLPAKAQVGQRFRIPGARGIPEDRATVLALNVVIATPAGRFTGCVKVRDALGTGGARSETKIYCPGVGLARVTSTAGVLNVLGAG